MPVMQPDGQLESGMASCAGASVVAVSGAASAEGRTSADGASTIGAPSGVVLAAGPLEDPSNAHPASTTNHNPRTARV